MPAGASAIAAAVRLAFGQGGVTLAPFAPMGDDP